MKVKKLTKAQAIPGVKVRLKGRTTSITKYKFDSDGYLNNDYVPGEFEMDLVTITEKSKKYPTGHGYSGEMVRFTIPGMEGEYLLFWCNFKELIDVSIQQREVNIKEIIEGPAPKKPELKGLKNLKCGPNFKRKDLVSQDIILIIMVSHKKNQLKFVCYLLEKEKQNIFLVKIGKHYHGYHHQQKRS